MPIVSGQSGKRVPGLLSAAGAVAFGLLVSAGAQAATTVWEVVAELEAALPLNESKIARTLGIALQKFEPGGANAFVYRSGSLKLESGITIESLTWTPRRGDQPASVALKMPPATARSETCLGRAEVSREYGAPLRNWTSQEGDVSLAHFEFGRPRGRVSVAFSDATNCLTLLTLAEAR